MVKVKYVNENGQEISRNCCVTPGTYHHTFWIKDNNGKEAEDYVKQIQRKYKVVYYDSFNNHTRVITESMSRISSSDIAYLVRRQVALTDIVNLVRYTQAR